MGKPQLETAKGFPLTPQFITTIEGEVLESAPVLTRLARDCENLRDLVQWELDAHGAQLLDLLEDYGDVSSANTVGRRMGISISPLVKSDLFSARTGLSRFEAMVQGEAVMLLRSWASRRKVARGEKGAVFVSAGYKRTARDTKPQAYARMNLAFTDPQYAYWEAEGALRMVVGGEWFVFHFRIPPRYQQGKIALPTVQVNDKGKVTFHFTEMREYQFRDISTRYLVGVDVGIREYATLVVWDTLEKKIVHFTALSQRSHSLYNSIRATGAQITALQQQGRKAEAAQHRQANVRKKRELAILVGQEIAAVAHKYENAVVVFEDLSWVQNTMANGRWNRGELVRWTRHYVEQNGSRVLTVNCAGTSQECHLCGAQVFHEDKPRDGLRRPVRCACGMSADRDVNAAANIAQRAVEAVTKVSLTRRKAKRYRPGRSRRRSPETKASLRYPQRDRRKTGPTPKRDRPTRAARHLEEVTTAIMESPRRTTLLATVLGDGETRTTPGPTPEGRHSEDTSAQESSP